MMYTNTIARARARRILPNASDCISTLPRHADTVSRRDVDCGSTFCYVAQHFAEKPAGKVRINFDFTLSIIAVDLRWTVPLPDFCHGVDRNQKFLIMPDIFIALNAQVVNIFKGRPVILVQPYANIILLIALLVLRCNKPIHHRSRRCRYQADIDAEIGRFFTIDPHPNFRLGCFKAVLNIHGSGSRSDNLFDPAGDLIDDR